MFCLFLVYCNSQPCRKQQSDLIAFLISIGGWGHRGVSLIIMTESVPVWGSKCFILRLCSTQVRKFVSEPILAFCFLSSPKIVFPWDCLITGTAQWPCECREQIKQNDDGWETSPTIKLCDCLINKIFWSSK